MTTPELTELTKRKTVELYEAIQQKSRFKLTLGEYRWGQFAHRGWIDVTVDLGLEGITRFPIIADRTRHFAPEGKILVGIRWRPPGTEEADMFVLQPNRDCPATVLADADATKLAENFDTYVFYCIFETGWEAGGDVARKAASLEILERRLWPSR